MSTFENQKDRYACCISDFKKDKNVSNGPRTQMEKKQKTNGKT